MGASSNNDAVNCSLVAAGFNAIYSGTLSTPIKKGKNFTVQLFPTGVVVFTFTDPLPASECIVVIDTQGLCGSFQIVHTSDTVKTVSFFSDVGVTPANVDHAYFVYVFPPGQ